LLIANCLYIAYNTLYIISRAGHASLASRAGRVSCSCSAGYVTRAGYVVCTLTDNC